MPDSNPSPADEAALIVPDLPADFDGSNWLSQPHWAAGAKIDFVFLDGSTEPPCAQTTLRLLTSAGLLLAEFDCRDPDASHLIYATRGHDSARLFLGDCVKMYFETSLGAFHIAVNPGGGYYDAKVIDGRDDPVWDPPLRFDVQTGAEGWRCRLALPLRCIFGEGGGEALHCRANFSRLRAGRENAFREETGWRPTGGQRFQAAHSLGTMRFEASAPSPPAADLPPQPCFIEPARPIISAVTAQPKALEPDDIPPPGPQTAELLADEGAPMPAPITRGQIFFADDTLIVRIHCADADVSGIIAPPDAAHFWSQDALEIHLAPGHKESDDYFYLTLNAAGAMLAERAHHAISTERITRNIARGQRAWAAEIRLPLDAMGVKGQPPTLWGMNLLHHRSQRGGDAEVTAAWSAFNWPPNDPERFGTLMLEKANDRLEACPTGAVGQASSLSPPPQFDFTVFTRAQRKELDLPEMVHNHLTAIRDAHYARLDLLRAQAKTWEQWLPMRQKMRDGFLASIGLPKKFDTPLNVRITPGFQANGVCIERILFQSRPNFYVTANLYRPAQPAPEPMPAVLRVIGHYKAGKFKDEYVRQLVELAGDGYIILVLDMPEQGERTYTANGFGAHNVTSSHYITATPCVLTGSNLAGYMVNDVMRALDYLLAREDVDPSRIVMTGCSGGGTLTGYVASLDDRITAAAPISALGSFRTLGRQGYDPEQNLRDVLDIGVDGEGQAMMIAPRPLCVIVECDDPARRAHTTQVYDRVRRLYNFHDADGRLEYHPTTAPHGVCAEHWRIFRDWLERTYPSNHPSGRKSSPTRCEVPFEALRVTRTGQAFFDRDLPERRTVADLNHGQIELPLGFEACVKDRASAEAHRGQIAAALRKLLHLADESMKPATVEQVSRGQTDGLWLEKIILQAEPGIYLPAIFIEPARSPAKSPKKSPVVIYFSQRGKEKILRQRRWMIESLAASGIGVLAVDLRGTGETDPGGERAFTGPAQCLDNFGFAVSRLVIGMRVRDALACANYCLGREDVAGDRIVLLGDNLAAVNPPHIRQPRVKNDPGLDEIEVADSAAPIIALLAAALDDRLAGAACVGALGSYADLASRSYFYHPTSSLIPGILKVCDIPDIAAALAPRPLLLAGAVNGLNQNLGAASRDVFAPVLRAYGLQKAADHLRFAERDESAVLAFLCNIPR